MAAVSAYDYQTDIAGITPEEESRLYADYYSGSVQGKTERILTDLFASQEWYPSYCAHPAVKALAEDVICIPTITTINGIILTTAE